MELTGQVITAHGFARTVVLDIRRKAFGMGLVEAFRVSLGLLEPRDRRKLLVVTVIQMSTSVLDLTGVLALGLVAALAVSASTDSELPASVTSLASRLGLDVQSPMSLALPLTVAAGLLLVSKSALSAFLTRRTLRFLSNRQAFVGVSLAADLMNQPLAEVSKRSSQQTGYALTGGVVAATTIILGHGIVVLSELSLMTAFAVGLILLDPWITMFAALFFSIIALVLHRLLAGWAARVGKQAATLDVMSLEAVQELLRSYRELTVLNRKAFFIREFGNLRFREAMNQSDLQFMGLVPKYVFEVALIIGAALLALSQLATRDLAAAMGTIVVFLAAGSRIVPSIMRLQGAGMSVRSASGQAQPTFDLVEELNFHPTKSPEDQKFLQNSDLNCYEFAEPFIPVVEVKHLRYSYPGSTRRALDDISFRVPPGSTLAIVGATGSGKSTLVDTVLGLAVPESGSVHISSLTPPQANRLWPGQTAYVPQEVGLLNGSVRENVAIGLELSFVDDSRIWEVLDLVRLGSFLRHHRDGLDTHIGENGMRLSGGQRQRLGLARAMYSFPHLLVLDEATSALDAETEVAVSEALNSLKGTVTIIVVAHRLSTVRGADQVAYMEDGRIHALGRFEEVRQMSAAFDKQARLLGL